MIEDLKITPEIKRALLICIGAFLFFSFYFVFVRSNRYSSNPVPQVLTVGTSADYQPISFLNADGEIVGFDIDIVKEVARRLDRSVDIIDMPFETLIPQIQSGALEMVVGGLTPTDMRKKVMNFSDNHYKAQNLVALSLKPDLDITSNNDLKKYVAIVNQGYFAVDILKNIPDIQLLELPSIAEGVLALESERGDVLIAEPHIIECIKKMVPKTLYMYPLDECNSSIAMGISIKYNSLVEGVNKALDEMDNDGTLDEIQKKWGLA